METPTVLEATSQGALVTFVSCDTHPPGFGVAATNQQWYIGLALHGRFDYNGHHGNFTLETGDLLLVRPGTYHRWVVPQPASDVPGEEANATILWAIFAPYPHWSDYLQGSETVPGFIVQRLSPSHFLRTRRSLYLAMRAHRKAGPNRDRWVLLALERALLGAYEEQRHFATSNLHLQRALDFIHSNIHRQLTLEEVAAASYISVSFLMKLFRRHLGVTPMAYVEQARLRRAQELLRHSHYPIAQIAALLGYDHPAYFTQRFRKAMDQTPGAYRKAARRGE